MVKIGGNVLDDPAALNRFLTDFAALPQPKILVHGGGKIASELGENLGLQPHYIQGRRVTDAATLDLVTMVYGGLINRQMTAKLQALGCNAIGLTGADANILPATKRPAAVVDYGWVGDVQISNVDVNVLQSFFNQGLTPVIAPLTHDTQGHLLNTNADTMSAVVASALTSAYAVRLLFCFEKKGILANAEDDASVLSVLDFATYQLLREKTAVSGGILPKLDNAFLAAKNGVGPVIIGLADDLRFNALGENVVGTLIQA